MMLMLMFGWLKAEGITCYSPGSFRVWYECLKKCQHCMNSMMLRPSFGKVFGGRFPSLFGQDLTSEFLKHLRIGAESAV